MNNNDELTAREKELLEHMRNGLSRKMAADQCRISKRTVDSHLKTIFTKLKVHNITEALKATDGNNKKDDAANNN